MFLTNSPSDMLCSAAPVGQHFVFFHPSRPQNASCDYSQTMISPKTHHARQLLKIDQNAISEEQSSYYASGGGGHLASFGYVFKGWATIQHWKLVLWL